MPDHVVPTEGVLTWYDRAGWRFTVTYRVTPRWLIVTTEDGEAMTFERAELEVALGLRPRGVLGNGG